MHEQGRARFQPSKVQPGKQVQASASATGGEGISLTLYQLYIYHQTPL